MSAAVLLDLATLLPLQMVKVFNVDEETRSKVGAYPTETQH